MVQLLCEDQATRGIGSCIAGFAAAALVCAHTLKSAAGTPRWRALKGDSLLHGRVVSCADGIVWIPRRQASHGGHVLGTRSSPLNTVRSMGIQSTVRYGFVTGSYANDGLAKRCRMTVL